MDDIVKSDTHLLMKPLSVAELIGNGAQFEVDTSAINNAFYEDFASDDNDDVENSEVDNETLVSPWTKSFDELRQLMTPISEHIFKRITREGIKEQGMVPEKARVALRYSAYWEGECAPFDSSMLRGTKFEFETGRNIVLEGLEAAVRSMHPYEQAEFIISYKLLFHELGCPPRIKPRADGLFKIEVINFMLIGDQQSLESIAPEDRCKFSIVYPKARDMHLHGKDCVKRGSYHSGITAFENAISSLNYCRLADEKDEQQQRELLITLNTNLMVCYNKLNIPKRACIAMKALRHLTQNQPSCKALFQEGRALVALGEYKRARLVFVQAQAKQPNNKEISDEIIKVDERVGKYKQSVREMWSRALSVQQQEEPKESNLDVGNTLHEQQFKRDFLSQLEKFEKSPQQSIHISRKMYTDEEFDVLRLLAVQRNFKLSLSPLDVDQLTLAKLQIK